jgi:hypothetical protein
VRGTLATSSQRYWKKFKCRQRLSIVSWTPHKALHCGHSKCSPGTCSSRSSKRFGSPSKRHSLTRHWRPNPSATVKSSSGVIPFTPVHHHPERKSLFASRPTSERLLRLIAVARNERRAVERKIQLPSPARSEACSREKRNKWQGPASGGKDAVAATKNRPRSRSST